ncbi:MAG: 30S ribosomal protein S6 [Patescibacteria group bacterium]
MKENLREDKLQVYEIGYLLVSSIPEDKVESEVSKLKEILSNKKADFIGEETAELRTLAYTMIKKIGQANHRFDKGYFGWFKFELASKEIESVKKLFEENQNVLRILLVNTIRENTYLGKKSAVPAPETPLESVAVEAIVDGAVEVIPAVASIEEMDKSIEAMVKEV